VDPLSAPDFENFSDRRGKKSRIKATNHTDSPIDLSDLREIKVLGDGMFGLVRLMENEDGRRYAVNISNGFGIGPKKRQQYFHVNLHQVADYLLPHNIVPICPSTLETRVLMCFFNGLKNRINCLQKLIGLLK
jgi:hypothetical protein